MKALLRPRVWLSLMVGLAVGAVLYTLPLERPRQVLPGWQASWGLCYSPDSQRLVTIHIAIDPDVPREKKGTARLWDALTGQLISVLEQEQESLSAVVFSQDSKQVAASNEKGDVKLWDADTGWPRGSYRIKGWEEWRSAAALAFSPVGQLLTQDPSKHKMWNAETGQEAFDFSEAVGKTTWSTYGGDSGFFMAGDDETIRVIRLDTGERIAEFPLPQPRLMAHHSAITPNSRVLVANLALQNDDPSNRFISRGSPWVWHRPGGPAQRLSHSDSAKDYVLAPGGEWMAAHFSVGPDRWFDWLVHRGNDPTHAISVRNLATGRESGVIRQGLHAQFAPDGRTLAVGCVGGTIELWDLPLRKAWAKIGGGAACAAVLSWLVLGWLLTRRRHVVTAGPKPSE